MNEAVCPNKHTVVITGTNSDGRNFSCGFCRQEGKPYVHSLPEKLIPKAEVADLTDAGLSLGLYGLTVTEQPAAPAEATPTPANATEAAPAEQPVRRKPGRPSKADRAVAPAT